MKRKLGIVLIIAIVALLPLTSCMSAPKASTPTAPVATEYDKSQDSSIASVKSQIEKEHQLISELQSNKLSKSEYTSSEAYPKTQTYTRSELYTRAEVDAKIAAAIDALKTEKPWGTGTSSSTTTSGTTTSSGGYTITLDRTQIISTSTETGNKDITTSIHNSSGAAKFPALLVSLMPISPFETSKLDASRRDVKSTISGFTTYADGTIQSNPDLSTLLNKLYWITPSFSLGNAETRTFWFNFDIITTDVITWNLSIKVLE